MTAIVLRGDARELPLSDSSVDLIVTSPPYFGLRSYQDGGEHYAGQIGDESDPREYVAALVECTREWMRVLKPKGSLWVNLGDKYSSPGGQTDTTAAVRLQGRPSIRKQGRPPRRAGSIPAKSLMFLPERYRIAAIDELGLIARAVVIWDKPNGLPESVTDRVRRSHEDWVHLVKQPHYFSAVDAIRQPHLHGGQGATWVQRKAAGQPMRHGDTGGGASAGAPGSKAGHPVGRLPGSVWAIATQPLKVPAHLGVDHWAAFPLEWPRRIIVGWSPPGGIVLDPFGGTGTTALVASALGRHGISVDRSADYCRIAQWRTTDRGERARAMGKPKPPPEPLGDRLFEVEL